MTLQTRIAEMAEKYAKDEYGNMNRHGTHYERDHDVAVSGCAFTAGAVAGYRLAAEELRAQEDTRTCAAVSQGEWAEWLEKRMNE